MESKGLKRIEACFFKLDSEREPVREWLFALPREDRREVGRALMTLEFGWPVSMPLSRPMGLGLHEIRLDLSNRRSARIFFYVDASQRLVLLHAYFKRSQITPKSELAMARTRMSQHRRNKL